MKKAIVASLGFVVVAVSISGLLNGGSQKNQEKVRYAQASQETATTANPSLADKASNISAEKVNPPRSEKELRGDPVPPLRPEDEIKRALTNVHSKNIHERVHSMQTLIDLSPTETANAIYALLANLESDPMAEGMVALGVLSLANNQNALSDEEIIYMYNSYDNENVRARTARVMAHRGDDSLLKDYVTKFSNTENLELEQKNSALLELANLQSRVAIPHISKYLDDADEFVRIQALGALGMTGNIQDIELIRPLLYDANEAVRQVSRDVLNQLTSRGQQEPVPTDIALHPEMESHQG